MKPGSIVLTELPQADGVRKVRPALILATVPPFDDYLVCGISTQLRHFVPEFDDLLLGDAPDFFTSGLKVPSVIRLGFLISLPLRRIGGVLGCINEDRLKRLRQNLAKFLISTP